MRMSSCNKVAHSVILPGKDSVDSYKIFEILGMRTHTHYLSIIILLALQYLQEEELVIQAFGVGFCSRTAYGCEISDN